MLTNCDQTVLQPDVACWTSVRRCVKNQMIMFVRKGMATKVPVPNTLCMHTQLRCSHVCVHRRAQNPVPPLVPSWLSTWIHLCKLAHKCFPTTVYSFPLSCEHVYCWCISCTIRAFLSSLLLCVCVCVNEVCIRQGMVLQTELVEYVVHHGFQASSHIHTFVLVEMRSFVMVTCKPCLLCRETPQGTSWEDCQKSDNRWVQL